MSARPLSPPDLLALSAAMLETPLLADLTPRAWFPEHSAPRELRDLLAGADYIHIWWRADAIGDAEHRAVFTEAVLGYLADLGWWRTREYVERVVTAVEAMPSLIDAGRARLTRLAAGTGRLLEEPALRLVKDDTPAAPRTAWERTLVRARLASTGTDGDA